MSITLDPTATDPRDVAHIIPERFYLRYVQEAARDASGKEDPNLPPRVLPVEMVIFAKKGQHIMTGQKTPMRITQARKDKMIWAVIEPYYEAWKKGQEVPTDGTPLSAWPGVTPEQVDRLKMLRARSVEDVAALNDNDIDSYGMGGLSLRQQARMFIEAKKDRTAIATEVATQMTGLHKTIADLEARLAAKPQEVEAPVKRKGGRPRKIVPAPEPEGSAVA